MQIHADPACEHLKTLLFCQAKTVPLKQGVTDKQLPEQTNIEALSQYVSGLMQGIAVMARQRSDRHLLNNITRV